MHFDILTLFPGLFHSVFAESIVKRAIDAGLMSMAVHCVRDHSTDKHHTTDDTPYGGGGGMVMKPEPIYAAVESVLGIPGEGRAGAKRIGVPVVLLTPQGRLFSQEIARALARRERVLLLCGRYEGVDERVREGLVTDELSIGDYVLSGGEIPAMVIVEAVTRLLPGVLGDPGATFEDSHEGGLLEYPHYTRPPDFRELGVPEVLLSGNHASIVKWRREQSLVRTRKRRPDLLPEARLTDTDREFLEKLDAQEPRSPQDKC